MKRVLVFGLSSVLGGIESYFHNYFKYVDHEKYTFDFVAVDGDVAYSDEYAKYGCKVYGVPSHLKHPLKYIMEVNKILNKNNYDIVYVNMLSAANIFPLFLSKKHKINKIIVHSHNADIPSNLVRRILHFVNKNKIHRLSTDLVACSDKAGKFLFGKKDYCIINNAIISDHYLFSESLRKSIRKELGLNEDDLVIGHIGRFSEQKNHNFILKLAESNNLHKNAKFVLFGTGSLKKDFIEKVDSYNLNNRFIIMDPVKDVYKYYNAFDIFILPSLFEGLPVVGIEAQFNGLPCLFSDAITREVKYNKNISFLELSDLDSWVEMINNNPGRMEYSKSLVRDYDIEYQSKSFQALLDGDGENE